MGGDGIGSRTQRPPREDVEGVLTLDEARDEAELLEFLASDLDPVSPDPDFRERLREELWALVQRGVTRSTDH
ncbi:MAG: hypothetical protein H6748_05300 [Spirochaetaceae bacterium]|nr:hypothetical protein [Myxococcales bacterium]MCA9609871.1 hypothetical protein [Myxococcales bacterium]MCB9723446.1 hypothetical protein [Spirochaetaceae bacterium]HPG25783.1 hypothetical protein [Myxococcota bacterium]